MNSLRDSFNRTIRYLRLSITDRCNFCCLYCLPKGDQHSRSNNTPFSPPLSIDEIGRLVASLSELGVEKVRITGGEPCVRRDIIDVIENIASTKEIKTISLTTNGYRLEKLAPNLFSAGAKNINVSVDSLDRERFFKITGQDRLSDILKGIEKAISIGLNIKINVVLLKDVNHTEIDKFIEWAKRAPISIRFIELMQTKSNALFFNRFFYPTESLAGLLTESGWTQSLASRLSGPSVEYYHKEYFGRIGIISPYSKSFCETCNRVRVTSSGELLSCLFATESTPLRYLLHQDDQREELKEIIKKAIAAKKISHHLLEGDYGERENLALIGG